MTIHRLHAGDGYLYLTKQVAAGDHLRDRTRDLTDYYTEFGAPPGVWMGSGATLLGLSGTVDEEQMQALFGEGLHPRANAIIAREIDAGKTSVQAIDAAKLGASFYEFSTTASPINDLFDRAVDVFIEAYQRRPDWDERTILRTDATRAHLTATLGRPPERAEIEAALAKEKAASRKAVAGFDCVFTPPKSLSILWGLGDDEIRRAIWQCHREAVAEVLAWAESRCAVTRRGHNGVRQIDAEGLVIAAFEHYDNRCGDMNLHTHATISGKVCGSDGKWSALDARPSFSGAVSFSCRYNATVVGKARRRIGLLTEERHRGRGKQPVLEVVGIGDEMIREFSRTPDIIARTEQLVARYRATHGHSPSTITQYNLAQQATLETRNAKPLPKALRDMINEWRVRARRFVGDSRSAEHFMRDLVHEHRHPPIADRFDAQTVAIAVGVHLGGPDAVVMASQELLDAAITGHLNSIRFADHTEQARAANAVRTLLNPRPDSAVLEQIQTTITARQRLVYDPGPIAAEVLNTVARRRATWTEDNIRSAVEDRVSVCQFATDAAQRAAVEEITAAVRDRYSIQLTIHPDPVPEPLARRNGESVFTVTGAIRYTSQAVLDAETRLLDAARIPTAEIVSERGVDAAIADLKRTEGKRLNAGQREIVRYLCTVGTQLAVAIGPAGSGKTTAMQAVCRAWLADGRTVIPLAPSASAARVLGEELGVRARTIAALLTQAHYRLRTGLSPGAMILIDEASMAATADLDAVLALARTHGAVIRFVGDPAQLSAVEAGGIFRTLAHDTRAPQLHQLVRFSDPDEAAATLAVREGNLERAWAFYDTHGRVVDGMSDQLRDAMLTAHLHDTELGVPSVMIAASLDDVSALNAATQAVHAVSGRIDTAGARILLSDNRSGYRGDVVVTRLNNPRLRITGGIRSGTQIDNGDLWRIHTIHQDGSVTITGIAHRGSVTLPPDYTREHVELGYATTIHRAEGITVDHAYVLMDATLGRSLAYVGLTRGRHLNRIFLATNTLIDPTGDQQPNDPDKPKQVFARVLAREDDNLSAIDVMRAEQAAADQRAQTSYAHAYQLLADARGTYLLDRALPVVFFREVSRSPTFQQLLDTIALADAHRLPTDELVAAIATNNFEDLGESLSTARDTAAVLRARADAWISDHLPATPPAVTIARVETLTGLDPHSAMTITSRSNTATTSTVRFRALRDFRDSSPYPPVPTEHPGMDRQLRDYTRELRRRLLTPTADTLLHDSEDATTTALLPAADFEPSEPPLALRRQRIERLCSDYHHYVAELANRRTEQLLDRALPVVLYRLAGGSRHWNALLDTVALADAHGLDTMALVGAIATDNHNDLGASLLEIHDPAAELRRRADVWIWEHVPIPPELLPKLNQLETLTESTDVHRSMFLNGLPGRDAEILAHAPRPRRFHALTDMPYGGTFRPIPNHSDRDNALADYAAELRNRIEHELQKIDATPVIPMPSASRPRPPDHPGIVPDAVNAVRQPIPTSNRNRPRPVTLRAHRRRL